MVNIINAITELTYFRQHLNVECGLYKTVNKIQRGIFGMSLDTYFILMLCKKKIRVETPISISKLFGSIMQYTKLSIKDAQFK
jgi:hypothetical protein